MSFTDLFVLELEADTRDRRTVMRSAISRRRPSNYIAASHTSRYLRTAAMAGGVYRHGRLFRSKEWRIQGGGNPAMPSPLNPAMVYTVVNCISGKLVKLVPPDVRF